MTQEAWTFHGPWTVSITLDPGAGGRLILEGTIDGDGSYWSDAGEVSVDGATWTITLQEWTSGEWVPVGSRRSASFGSGDGLRVTLSVDTPELVVVLRSDDPSVNPPPPGDTIPHDFTFPEGMLGR